MIRAIIPQRTSFKTSRLRTGRPIGQAKILRGLTRLSTFADNIRTSNSVGKTNPNEPSPELAPLVNRLMTTLLTDASVQSKVRGNRALEAMHAQSLSHLRNVSFSLRTEIGNDDYPHELVLKGPYPYRPTLRAIEKAQDFLRTLDAKDVEIVSIAQDGERKSQLLEQQKQFLARITQDPLKTYQGFSERLEREGPEASFPEFSSMVEYLKLELRSDPDVLQLCRENAALNAFRSIVLEQLDQLPAQLPYLNTFYAIERAIEFFDVLRRAQSPEPLPPIYHSAHYEYYLHSLMGELPGHIAIPTLADVGVTDLLKLRGVPIGILGVKTDSVRVDGFNQTPYELFVHDANHARRMYQLAKERAKEKGISEQDYYAQAAHFVQMVLVPLFVPSAGDEPSVRRRKQITKMILFEFLHEQSFPADSEVLITQILRPPSQRTPFERIENDSEVVYYTEHRPTCLAYAFRKLAHDYYDEPTDRKGYIVAPVARTRQEIVQATVRLLEGLGLRHVPLEALKEFVRSDDFPNASFRAGLQNDIRRRPDETVPLGIEESKTLQPLLLLKSQFQKTLQQVTPWDGSSFRFLYRRNWQETPLFPPKVGTFTVSGQPLRKIDVKKIRNALKEQNLDELVIVLSRNPVDGTKPSVEDLALQALMIQAVFKDQTKVSIAVTGGNQADEIRRNIRRHYPDPEIQTVRSPEPIPTIPSSALLRVLLSDGEYRLCKRWIASEAAALIERWALYKRIISAEERRQVWEREAVLIDSLRTKKALQNAENWQGFSVVPSPSTPSKGIPVVTSTSTPESLRAMGAVYSYFFPIVRGLISDLTRDFPHGTFMRSMRIGEGLDDFDKPILERFVNYQAAAVPALRDFSHRYTSSGSEETIREFLSHLALRGVKRIYALAGEYEGYRAVAKTRGIETIDFPLNTDPGSLKPGWFFLSNPSARNGNILPNEFVQRICEAGHRIFYDLSYLGITDFHTFDLSHPNIAVAAVSFSKPYGLFYFRQGFTFSREPIEGLAGNIWFKNILSLMIADTIMRHLGPLELPRQYRPLQERIVARLNARHGLDLKASDVVLLAHRDNDVGLTEAQKKLLKRYRRGDGYRLTLTPYFLEAEFEKPLHTKARGQHPGYPTPVEVPDAKVDWDVSFPDYKPMPYTDPIVLKNDRTKKPDGWADEADFSLIKEKVQKRKSFEGPLKIDPVTGMLLNPMGRTGKTGRGNLGAYGPNFAADPIVTRMNPQTGRLQMIAVRRVDTGEWSIPGCHVNSSKELLEFMRRGFARKALGASNDQQKELQTLLDALFANGKVIKKGYMDDSKNTDIAWMESVSVHFHASDDVARKLILRAGADVLDVEWLDVDKVLSGRVTLYANHGELVRNAIEGLRS